MLLECPECGKKSLCIKEKRAGCLSCSYTNEGEKAAGEWVRKIIGKGDTEKARQPVCSCPQCGAQALVDRSPGGERQPDPQYLCFSCGGSWPAEEIESCPECGRPEFSAEFEELIICRSAAGFYVCRKCYEKIFQY